MSEKKHEISAPSINRPVEYHPAEHEYFLSFLNDEDAELFDLWWNSVGFAAFKRWARRGTYPEFYR